MSKKNGILSMFTVTFKILKWAVMIVIFPITLTVLIIRKVKAKKLKKAEEKQAAQNNRY